MSRLIKFCSLGADLFHSDRRTDRQTDRHVTKLIIALRNFVNFLYNGRSCWKHSNISVISICWLEFGVILCEVSTRTTKDRDRLGNLTSPQR